MSNDSPVTLLHPSRTTCDCPRRKPEILAQEKDRCKHLCEQADGTKLELTLLQSSMTTLRSEVQKDFKAYLSSLNSLP